jgi:hypothetical protein
MLLHTKILLAIFLILNHSLLIGEIQAAAMPDEEHSVAQESPMEHAQEFSLGEHLIHDHSVAEAQHDCVVDHFEHADHHQHGMHISLSLALPDEFMINMRFRSSMPNSLYLFSPQNQTYSPPTPPPTF